MKEAIGWFFALVSFSGFVCEVERMHMLVIYIEYQGLCVFGLEILNS